VTLSLQVKKVPESAAGSASSVSSSHVVKKLPPSAVNGKAKPPPPPLVSGLDSFKYKHTAEDAESLALELIPAKIAADFIDSNWKTRLAALEEMASWVEQEVEHLDAEIIVRFVAKKGWTEKNFQARPNPVLSFITLIHFLGVIEDIRDFHYHGSAEFDVWTIMLCSLYTPFDGETW